MAGEREDQVEQLILKRLIGQGHASLPQLIPPVELDEVGQVIAEQEIRQLVLIMAAAHRRARRAVSVHPEQIRQRLVIVLLAILLSHPFFHELVPIVDWKTFRTDHQLIPVAIPPILTVRLFCDVNSIKFQLSRDFLLALEDYQWNFEVIVGNEHTKREEGMNARQEGENRLPIVVFLLHNDPFNQLSILNIAVGSFLVRR